MPLKQMVIEVCGLLSVAPMIVIVDANDEESRTNIPLWGLLKSMQTLKLAAVLFTKTMGNK